MKPRIRLHLCVWDCCLPDWKKTRVIGYGNSPLEAYKEWAREWFKWFQGAAKWK